MIDNECPGRLRPIKNISRIDVLHIERRVFTHQYDIKVTKVGKPDDVKYNGHMKATVSYEGAYEITTPAGKFEAALMKGVYDIKVGPADVKDVQYLFYAPGVGKVAEIESLSVSALLIYHSHDKTAKILTKHPGSSK